MSITTSADSRLRGCAGGHHVGNSTGDRRLDGREHSRNGVGGFAAVAIFSCGREELCRFGKIVA